MNNYDNEPSNEDIEDYNKNNESKEHKKTVNNVLIFLLILGSVLVYLKLF